MRSILAQALARALPLIALACANGPKDSRAPTDTGSPYTPTLGAPCTDEEVAQDLVSLCESLRPDGRKAGESLARACSRNFGPAGPEVPCERCAAAGDYKEVLVRCWLPAFEEGFLAVDDPPCETLSLLEDWLTGFAGGDHDCYIAE